jgi:hypothetical protein
MVKKRRLPVALIGVFIFMTLVTVGTAEIQYHLEHEWVKIWINQDGTIDLLYDISITHVIQAPSAM